MAIGVLLLSKTVTSLLAEVGVVGLALGFAFQNTAANFISGIFLATKHPINVGDIVEANGFFGAVEKKAFDENGITIPFPIRTLDFGAKGGIKLSEELPINKLLTNEISDA